jgi:hypothetical protein
MSDPNLDAIRGALTYLDEAERRITSVRGDSLGWAIAEQFVPDDTRYPGGRAPWLLAPVWLWALPPALVLGWLTSFLGLLLVGLIIGAALGVACRVWYTLSLTDKLRNPSEEVTAEIHRALGEAARFMHEAGIDWVGGDPSVVRHPWQMLAPVRATRTLLRTKQLP